MLKLSEFKAKLKSSGAVDWSVPAPPLEFFWCFEMKASRDEVWAYLSDTSRFNREVGMAPRTQTEREGKVIVKTTLIGIEQEWIELPWTWIAGETIALQRKYIKGMAQKVHVVFHMGENAATNRRLIYIYFGWTPKNAFWKSFLNLTASHLEKRFRSIFQKIDQHSTSLLAQAQNALQIVPHPLTDGAKVKLARIQAQLLAENLNPLAVNQLCEFVSSGDDFDLESIRLKQLSKKWNLDLKDLLVTSLHATRLGLLKISWKVICPHCRGSRIGADSLGDIPEASSCSVCEIDFATSEAESIEVIFHVHPSIRYVEEVLFCAAEPAKKSHIKIQQSVEAGASLSMQAPLRAASYRGRWIKSKRSFQIEVDSKTNSPFELHITNPLDEPDLFVLEEMWWQQSALKPADLLALPTFRDLFSEEHLSANVRLYLGEQSILFTDIVGSTVFYNQVGDAKAFAEVRAHFQEVFKEVAKHNGVVVKTIGDAVMGSFPSVLDALSAALSIQERFRLDRSDTTIRLRVSVHTGPVIAVHLNQGLDYFGSTVNFAAKIQSCAGAGEIVMDEAVFQKTVEVSSFPYALESRKNLRDSAAPVRLTVIKSTKKAVSAA